MFNNNSSSSNNSNSNLFPQTNINDAYQFNSFSNFVNNVNSIKTVFSANCIFCPSKESTSLTTDGSFRQCNRCKKQFRAFILNNHVQSPK